MSAFKWFLKGLYDNIKVKGYIYNLVCGLLKHITVI